MTLDRYCCTFYYLCLQVLVIRIAGRTTL